MKQNIHPTVYNTVFVDTSCGAEFLTTSTLKGETTREIDGVTYQVVNIEISSASHPFFTGKQILIDTAKRVEKFEERAKKMESNKTVHGSKRIKNATRAKKRKQTEDAK